MPYEPVHIACGALVAHLHSFMPPLQNFSIQQDTVHLSVSLGTHLNDPLFDGVRCLIYEHSQ